MTEERDRRAVPRTKLEDQPAVRIQDGKAVRLLDVSRVGAGIEHLDFLRPGASCTLELPPPFGSLTIPSQVMWCRVTGRNRRPGDETHLVSRSGLRFASLNLTQHAALAWLLSAQPQPAM
jgi:hypothetical protein